MIPARAVLYLLSFSGFLVSFMMRTDINIAMVAMAKMRLRSENSSNITELTCYTPSTNGTQVIENQTQKVKNLRFILIIDFMCSKLLHFFSNICMFIP